MKIQRLEYTYIEELYKEKKFRCWQNFLINAKEIFDIAYGMIYNVFYKLNKTFKDNEEKSKYKDVVLASW